MTRRVAAIDLGSNTVRLLVADVDPAGAWTEVARDRRITRLGEGLHATGAVTPAAIRRTADALREFGEKAQRLGVEETAVVGTSAVREAANRSEITAAIRSAAGLSVEVIDGEEEARRMWLGVRSEVAMPPGTTAVVVDIGGGSTEWIAGDDDEVFSLVSLPVGVVRLSEQFPVRRALGPEERERLKGVALEAASRAAAVVRPDPPVQVIGTAGTPTTLAALDMGLEIYDRARVSGYRMSSGRVENWFERLAGMDASARLDLPGLEAGREDLIVPGAALLWATLSVYRGESVVVSDGGLLEGILIHRFAREGGLCGRRAGV
jgi:exopolyphosphatase/guanosine-5'-triphosphate,3'-diphosphate pyrophosphatase